MNVFLSVPFSSRVDKAGVQMEIGYAIAKSKKVKMYQIGKPGWSNLAVSAIGGNEMAIVQNIDDFVARIIASS